MMATQTEDQFAGRPLQAAMRASEINKAIAQVMGKVGAVRKGGTNTFHNYKYASAADILHKLQPLSAEAGLIIFQHEKSVEMLYGDSVMKATYEFSLAHASGEERSPIIRSGMSGARNTKGGFDDKALNKCSTAALKYFLLNLFQIPTGDYDDADKEEDKAEGTITQEQADNLSRRLEAAKANMKVFCEYLGVGSIPAIPASLHERALELVEAKEAKVLAEGGGIDVA